MRSRKCKKVSRVLRSAISVASEISVNKLRVEDTEAYQGMMRMNYETFCEVLTTTVVILPFAISVWVHL